MRTFVRMMVCAAVVAALFTIAPLAVQPAVAGEPVFAAKFNPKAGELPEGVAVHKGMVVVNFAPRQLIVQVNADGSVKPYAQLPKAPRGKGFVTGMTFDPAGNLYANLVSMVPEPKKGVYKIAPGGEVSLLVSDKGFGFLNGLIWHKSGNLFATDSARGAVYRISPGGKLSNWSVSPLLKGDKDACPPAERNFSLGANGLTFGPDGALYVGVTDRGMIVRIPANSDGSAGKAEIFAGPDCGRLEGMDGAATSPDGKVYMTSNHHNKIYRIGMDKSVTTVAAGGILDFPASIMFGGDGTLYIANFALGSVRAKKPDAQPGLITLKP